MHSRQESNKVNNQMSFSSPRCSLNCQGLSVHLPPLGGRRDTSTGNIHRSPPMSGTLLQQSYERPTPELQNGYAEPSVSPPSPPSTLGKRSPNSPRAVRVREGVVLDERVNLGTSIPSGTERKAKGISRLQSSNTGRVMGDSNDEYSATSPDSPEAQLMPGVPGVARRAKAHVPSACVNCKKKHLACETKRPCNRCMQTGKEATCVDVQHKKRGRPRLREEDSLRGLAFGPEYPAGELYESQPNGVLDSHPSRHRSKTYRELRSQPETAYMDQRPRTSESHFLPPQYYPVATQPGCFASQCTPTAILTTEFIVVHHNRALSEALSLSFSVGGQALLDLVVPSEKERIRRLQSSMRTELRDTTFAPAYMSSGHNSPASFPTIENIDISHATAGFRTRSEYWTFRLPGEQSRGFPISISLGQNGSPFVVLTLVQSAGAFSPPAHAAFQSSPVLSSPTSITAPSPTKVHLTHQHHRNSSTTTPMPYIISFPKSTLDDQLLALQPSHSLAQYKNSPPRSVQQLPYEASRTGSSSSTTSGGNLCIPRNSPAHRNQPLPRDSLRHLQLPPIRTTPTSDPSTPGQNAGESRRRIQGNTPSPGRGSPGSAHGGKRKKRRRVEIGDILR